MDAIIKSSRKFPIKGIWYLRNNKKRILKRIKLDVDEIEINTPFCGGPKNMIVYAYLNPSIKTLEFINKSGLAFFNDAYSVSIKVDKPFKRKGVLYSSTRNGQFRVVSYDISHGFGGGESMKIEFQSCSIIRKRSKKCQT